MLSDAYLITSCKFCLLICVVKLLLSVKCFIICLLTLCCRCVSIEERTIGSVVSNQTPLHTWSHTLPVTDVHIGHGGLSARVFSASLDHTVKVSVLLCLNVSSSVFILILECMIMQQ